MSGGAEDDNTDRIFSSSSSRIASLAASSARSWRTNEPIDVMNEWNGMNGLEWMDGWMDGLMDGWMDAVISELMCYGGGILDMIRLPVGC